MVLHSTPLVNLCVHQRLRKGEKGKQVAITVWMGMACTIRRWTNAHLFRNEEIKAKKIFEELRAHLWS